jgi:hypothetical protein
MHHWQHFKTPKERGEWVELRFMAAAAERGLSILKPWGDTRPYDVGIEHAQNFLRVQVKSTTYRTGTGYLCQFKPNYNKKQDYTVDQLDLFASYVIPEDSWYIIPSHVLLGPVRKQAIMIHPVDPLLKDRYLYESYKEAWPLLYKSRRALAAKYRQN